MFSKSVRWTHVKFTTFTARNAAVDNGEGALIHACELMPNNKIGFGSGNRCVRVKRRTRATTGTRKDTRERIPEKGYPRKDTRERVPDGSHAWVIVKKRENDV